MNVMKTMLIMGAVLLWNQAALAVRPCAVISDAQQQRLLVLAEEPAGILAVNLINRQVQPWLKLKHPPTGAVQSSDGKTLFVTCAAPESEVCVVDVARARITAKLPAGHTAMAPVLAPDGKTLFVCNRFNNDVSVLDLPTQKELKRIPVLREPVAATITADGKYLLVANHLPTGRADAERVGAIISVVDVAQGKVVKDLLLPDGSGSLHDLRISPDGKYAVVTHLLARFRLPTTQLERGWMHTNAGTIIALDRMEVLNTVLLDTVDRGAANPWGAAWSADGKTLVVAHAGTHEVSLIDFPALLAKLTKPATPQSRGNRSYAATNSADDLSLLGDARKRQSLPEGDLGPRAVVVVGHVAYTANYFSDTLTAINFDGVHSKTETIALGPKPKMTTEQQGELYFNDARICFQGWQSCASCHPGGARVDALNWDLLNDGMGNPKNTKSMLLAFRTPPAMSTGVRENAAVAVRAGIRYILFTVQPPEVATALDAYLKSLQPVPSPYLVKGKLSAAARRGEELFHNSATSCARCHTGPLFTNLKSYDVGTRNRFDKPTDLFDTPTLVELWRTAPYLHDGSAATLRDVLTSANKQDLHGRTSLLTEDQINDLIEYLLSL
ncbi:MAG: cell surface protein [Verrucomicrobia bacterium]|nr:MAG: cell surface protein [Verrucomicrobiota bacterium]